MNTPSSLLMIFVFQFIFASSEKNLYVLQLEILNATCDGSQKAALIEPYQRVAFTPDHISSRLPPNATIDDNLQSEPCRADKAASTRESCFFLPDLNMMPSEVDSGSETLYGIS